MIPVEHLSGAAANVAVLNGFSDHSHKALLQNGPLTYVYFLFTCVQMVPSLTMNEILSREEVKHPPMNATA